VIPFDSVCPACYERDVASASLSGGQERRPAPPPSAPSGPIREEKGLTNRAGDNHCFLNVTIQSLWHLTSFRALFEARPVQHAPDCSCVYCALTLILTNYRFAASNVLAPDVLRRSLDLLYAKDGKFQLGDLSDAVECFDAICTTLHQVSVVVCFFVL
jgi:hypothetical protein